MDHIDKVLQRGYNPSKLKPQLKMAITRLNISSNKKSALMKQQIREIATMLSDNPPREEKARIRAEALIRDDNTIEAYEILALHCELLSERIHLISHSKRCPHDLASCVSTLIWASNIVDIPELQVIRTQFRYKFGKGFDLNATLNMNGVVNARVAEKLSVHPPSAYEVQMYLEKIAEEQEVDWKPKQKLNGDGIVEPMGAPSGYSVPTHGGSGLFPDNYNDVDEEESRMGSGGGGGGGGGGGDIVGRQNEDYDNDVDYYDDEDDGYGGLVGPSAPPPPISPMTVNTFRIPEAPRSNINEGKSWATVNTTNTAPTMASTAVASASMTLPPAYVPVLPVPSSSHAQASNKYTANYGRQEWGEANEEELHRSGGCNDINNGNNDNHGGNGNTQNAKEEEDNEEELRNTVLIDEALKLTDSFEQLIAKFERLNEKKK
ncbi:hypothetical protein ACHAWU_007624 [Discostella pseudostelligera]|uniref:IST1 homolog n=1 Tax=Discostella pseudostelligera TaxID=259834 RepID=A0ABD3M736_9STRA